MKKVFLCHASEDKEYVRIVAKKLTRAKVIFDEISFEVAADFRDQILKGLDDTSIFVFMVSRKSIEKIWCRFEIDNAQLKVMSGDISKCLSIIIDKTIPYEALPLWMRKTKSIIQTRPSQAIREIQNLLFSLLPDVLKRPYIGRHAEIEEVSEKIALNTPHVFSIYGLDGIGRRSFLERICQDYLSLHLGPFFLIDSNYTIDEVYPLLLEEIADIGAIKEFSENISLFKNLSYNEKIDEIVRGLELLCQDRNMPCFVDYGGMMNESGEFRDYIKKICQHFSNNTDDFYCAFVHQRKVLFSHDIDSVCFSKIGPLQDKETILLLRQLLNNAEIRNTSPQISILANAISGYPPAAYFALSYIKQYGIDVACESLCDIIDFNAKNFTPYLNTISFTDNEKLILTYMAAESPMPLDAIAIALDLPKETLAIEIKNLIDLCLIVVYDGVYSLSSPIKNSITRLWGLRESINYDDIAIRLSREYWKDENIAPSILVIDATIHAAVMAKKDISVYGNFVSASTLLRFATDFYRQKKWSLALDYSSRALKIDKNRTEAKILKFKSCVQIEQFDDAIVLLNELSSNKEFFYLEGFWHKKRGEYSSAAISFKKALDTGDKSYSVYRDYADVLYRLRNYPEAERNLLIVLKRDNRNIFVLDLLIRLYMQLNRFHEAKNALLSLEKNDVDEKFIHHRKAALAIADKNYELALCEAEMACSKQDGLFEAFGQKANVLIEMAKYEEATECLDSITDKFGRRRLDVQLGLRCKLFIKQKKWQEANAVWNRISNKDSAVNRALLASILKLESYARETSLSRRNQIHSQLEAMEHNQDNVSILDNILLSSDSDD